MNYIYKITNLINGKVYIGQHRWNGDGLDPDYFCSSKNPHFWNAVKKYGIENFKKEIIEVVDDKSIIDERETYWIRKYFGENCYNLMDAASSWNAAHTPEAQKRAVETKRANGSYTNMDWNSKEARVKAVKTYRSKYGDLTSHMNNPETHKKAMESRTRNNSNDASRINTPEAQAKRNRIYDWYYNGVLVYTGKCYIASKMMHLRNQVWDQFDHTIV